MTSKNTQKTLNEELDRISIDEFKQAQKIDACIILDDIRSLNNVGSSFRTADAFRINKIYLCGITGKPPHREIQKAALGATDSVDWDYVEDIIRLIRNLKKTGWTIVAVEQTESSISLTDFKPEAKEKYAFIFGHEVMGVKQRAVNQADICLEIPQFGTKHSFNISVSVGIVLWDFFTKKYPQGLP